MKSSLMLRGVLQHRNVKKAHRFHGSIGGFLLLCILVLAPSLLLLKFLFNATLFDLKPSSLGVFNDELAYWHHAFTFSQTGFHGGYYVFHELPARASFTHFGPHGPFWAVLYGSIGHLAGWHDFSVPLINLVMLLLAVAIFLLMTRPDFKSIMVLAGLLATYWPLHLFAPSSMQEGFHLTVSILLAALLACQLQERKASISGYMYYGTILFILGISLIRFSWALIFIPLFLMRKRLTWWNAMKALCMAICLIGCLLVAFQYFAAPSYRSIFASLPHLWDAFSTNLHHLFSSSPLESSVPLEGTMLVLWLTGSLGWLLFRYPQKRIRRDYLFHILNVGIILVLVAFTYKFQFWRGYRVISPHLLMSLLLLAISFKGKTIKIVLGMVIVTNLLLTPAFIKEFQVHRQANLYDTNHIEEFRQEIQDYVAYQNHQNGWCNTMLLQHHRYTPEIMAIPGGIGLSVFFNFNDMKPPLKSKYVLLEQETGDQYAHKSSLIFLVHTRLGDLYLNQGSQCE